MVPTYRSHIFISMTIDLCKAISKLRLIEIRKSL